MTRRGGTQRGRLPRLALGLAFAGVLLAVAEVALRIGGAAPAYQADLIGGWRMLPEMRAQRMTGREGHAFVLTTNADGLRTGVPRERRAGVARVALLGDSTTFGWGADDGGTVADGVQQALDADGGPAVEVMNAGQPGYTTTQAAAFFDAVVRHYRPDLVVMFLPLHDHNRVLVSDREHLRGAEGPVATVRVALASRSRLYQAVRQRVFPLTGSAFLLPEEGDGEPRVPRVSDAERGRALREIEAAMQAWGGRVTVGHLPFVGDLEAGRAIARVGDTWAQGWADAAGMPLVDARACCAAGSGGLVLANDPGHLRAEGNLAAGRAAAPAVRAALARTGAALASGSGSVTGP